MEFRLPAIHHTRSLSVLLLFIISLLATPFFIQPACSDVAPELEITATTDKYTYNVGETIQVTGTLTLNGSLIPDGLVAVQVNDPSDDPAPEVVMRTLATPIPPDNLTFEIVEVVLLDTQGNPKDAFSRGAYLTPEVTILNGGTVSRDATLTFNIFDVDMVSVVVQRITPPPISPGLNIITPFSIPIPYTASLGEAIVCVNAYNRLPEEGGTPYCPEASATFTIAGGHTSSQSTSGGQVQTTGSNGTFNLEFKLPSYGGTELGVYRVYLTSRTGGRPDTLLLAFEIKLKADLNGDGVVDIYDIVNVAKAFNSRPGDPNWEPRADLNDDDVVDIYDVVAVALDFGKTVG